MCRIDGAGLARFYRGWQDPEANVVVDGRRGDARTSRQFTNRNAGLGAVRSRLYRHIKWGEIEKTAIYGRAYQLAGSESIGQEPCTGPVARFLLVKSPGAGSRRLSDTWATVNRY